jgi:phosphoglycolate phosphatase
MNKPNLVLIWDYDGTLYNTLPSIVASIIAVQENNKLVAPAKEKIEEIVGQGGTVEEVLSELWNIPKTTLAALVTQYRNHYSSVSYTLSEPFPQIRDVLKELSQGGIRHAVVSNKGKNALIDSLQRDRLIDYFDLIIGAESGNPQKPDSAIFTNSISPKYPMLNTNNFCVIGDTITDYRFAKNCGLKFILCEYGYGCKMELGLVTDITRCRECTEIPHILNN